MPRLSKNSGSTFMVVLAFATVYIVWGSTYLFIQKTVHGIPPFLTGSLRFLTAGLLLLGWCTLRGEHVFEKRSIRDAAISGILLLFIGNGIVIWIEQFMSTSVVAITLSSSPLWFIILDKPMWKESFRSRPTIIGLIIGFAGVVLLFGENLGKSLSAGNNSTGTGGLVLILIGSVAWSAGSIYSKYHSHGSSAPVSTAWQMIAAGTCYLPVSLVMREPQHLNWQQVPTESWLSLVYLVFFGSIAAFSAYVWLLQVRPATQVSTYAYINPVVAVILGMLFANEHVTRIQLTGLTIILGSVLLINLSKNRTGKGNIDPSAPVDDNGKVKNFDRIQLLNPDRKKINA